MTTKSLITPLADGYDIHPAGVLILMASEVYHYPERNTDGQAKKHLDAVLAAARAGGFKQCDILVTLLSQKEVSSRVAEMAIKACALAGTEALVKIFESMRKNNLAAKWGTS